MKKSAFATSIAVLLASSLCATPQKSVDITVSGYTGASPLANFPVLVRISPERISGFSYADCAAGGADIAFEDAEGNALDREIDTWDPNGESLIWVRLPSMAADDTFRMTYKDLSVTAQPACQTDGSVWDAAGYAGVWHLGEDSGTAYDSSPNGLHGTVNAGYEGTCIATDNAKVGKGRYAPASAYLTLPNFRHLALGNTFTFSGWFKYDPAVTIANNSPMLFYGKTTWNSTSDGWYVCLQWTSSSDTTKKTIGINGAGGSPKSITIDSIKSAWVHVSVVFNNTASAVYSNGALKGSPAITAAKELASSVMPKLFMSSYAGYGDEVRIRDAVNSADWVKAEYQTVANNGFLSYGMSVTIRSNDRLTILGDPVECGSPTPAYGPHPGIGVGESQTLSMPGTVVAGEGTVTNYLLGWKLEAVDLATGTRSLLRTSSNPGESIDHCEYIHDGCSVFTWLWDVRDALGVDPPAVVAKSGSYLTLSAAVTGIGYTAPSATLKFVYGVSPDAMIFTNVVAASVTDIGEFSAPITRLAPGTAYYVKAVMETNDEAHDIAESDVVCLTTEAEKQFAIMNASLSRSRLSATVSGSIGDFDGNSSATVSLWAGTSGDANSFTQVGQSITVTDSTTFTLPWTLPAFDTAYWWQVRAVGDDLDQTDATGPASVIAPSAVVYIGASGGDWHTASNWELGEVPSASDGAIINGKWVKATNSISTASITITGNGSNAGLVVGGTTLTAAGVKAQTPFSATSTVPYSITLSGDLVLDGAGLSLGARREAANVSATIGGDFIITNGAVAAIYAGQTAGVSPTNRTVSSALLYANANVIAVGGELRVCSGSYLYPENDGLTGTPVFFKPTSFTVEKGGTVSAEGRGWGKYKYTSGATNFPIGSLSDANSSEWYSYAFGAGQSYTHGGAHGASSGSGNYSGNLRLVKASDGSYATYNFTSKPYGYAYAPFLPGSPNGCYNSTSSVRGGGSVCVFATGSISVAGTITVRGTDATYGASSGGGIWLSGATFDISRSASMTAEGGKVTGNYSSSGGAGRISLTAGATQAQLDALATGDTTGFKTAPLYGFKFNVLGGYKNNGSTGRSASGTAVMAYVSSSRLPVEVAANPEELSTATPAYGFHVFDKSAMPAFSLAAASTYPEYYRDHRRYAEHGYIASNTTGVVSGSLVSETDPLTLTWQWTGIEDLVRVRPVGGGAINVNGTSYAANADLWVLPGTPLSISATDGTGTFSTFYGDFGSGQTNATSFTTAATPGMTIWGVFSDAASAAKTYSGPDNNFWDVDANWTPTGVPTPADEVMVSAKKVRSYGLAVAKSLTLSAGALVVGGASATTTTAQTAPNDAYVVDCGLIVASNLTATGASAISIGARRQTADLLRAKIDGNLSLAGSSTLAVYAPAYKGSLNSNGKIPLTNYYHSAFAVEVGGDLSLTNTAVVYPEADLVTGNPVRFEVGGNVSIGAGTSFNASQRGFGWVNSANEGDYIDPRNLTTSSTYYTLAPGYGSNYSSGGAYGGGNSSAPRKKYGYAYAPYLPGSPNGIYAAIYRGGGNVWIKTPGIINIAGAIYANGGGASGSVGCSSGGGIWLVAGKVESGSSARLQANGIDGGWGNSSPGTGGRVSIALGVSDSDLEALAQGQTPSRLTYSDSITVVTATVAGGTHGSGSSAVASPAGTLTTVTGAVDSYPLEIRSIPVAVATDGLNYTTISVDKGAEWSSTVGQYGYDPAYRGTVRFTCLGWVISNSTEQVAAGNGTTASFIPKTGPFSLTWLWTDRETFGSAIANDAERGVVSIDGGVTGVTATAWTSEARSVALSATPVSGAEFLYWVGDVPYGQAKANPATIPADQPFSIKAVFRAAEAATTRTWAGASGASGIWDDPSNWSPANIPGPNDEVIVGQGYVLATNRIEVGSLRVSGSGVVIISANLNWGNRGQGVGYNEYAWNGSNSSMLSRFTGTRLGEAALIVSGDVVVTNAGQLALGARNQQYHSTVSIGGDLVVCGAPSQSARLLVASGPINETFTLATGTTPATIGGTFRIGANATAYVWSEQYTGGSVAFRVAGRFMVDAGGTVNATQGGFFRFSERYPISLAPGLGGDYTPGGGYGGRGGNWSSNYPNVGRTYGFPYAPVHPGSCAGVYQFVRPAGGLIRVHAEKVVVAGTIVANGGLSSSGGGIWLTSRSMPKFAEGALLQAKGGERCTDAGAPGGGGRIAIGIGLTDAQIAEMSATGVVAGWNMGKRDITDAFTADNPGVAVDVAAGEAIYTGSIGTFHVLDMRQAATFLMLK